MKDYIISTRDEYEKAIEHISLLRKRPFFDIECGKGTEIVEEVDYLMYYYLYRDGDTKTAHEGLSRLDFDRPRADAIMRYFKEHLPRDMFDIERGLNRLRIIPPGYAVDSPDDLPKIIIKDSREKIAVRSDAEVRGNSFVEAFENASVIAKNDAYIIARDAVSVEAYHKSRVDAYDQSRISAFNNVLVTASGESRVEAHHKSRVMAGEKSTVLAYNNVFVKSAHEAGITAFDEVLVDACGNSKVNAFNTSHIIARNDVIVSAHEQSFVYASDRSKIEARDQSCVAAGKNALVTASGDSLVLTRDNARSITGGNSSSIDEKSNNAKNLRENMLTVMRLPRFAKDPMLAVKVLMRAVPEKNRAAINKKLLALGCTDADKMKNILNRLIKPREEDISYER